MDGTSKAPVTSFVSELRRHFGLKGIGLPFVNGVVLCVPEDISADDELIEVVLAKGVSVLAYVELDAEADDTD